ncbi:MAG: hypothetical protein JWQ84_242 [Mucilaginibacter sp.]|jgi:hypothetical protein|nr:hypothetical protein [Mucilaginibacter sp.]MDB5015410.1 hypothetical protein [Mucilaginibacter sp.]MDB5138177.1 hypothetical protein [Mucilaginibacter sp.]
MASTSLINQKNSFQQVKSFIINGFPKFTHKEGTFLTGCGKL